MTDKKTKYPLRELRVGTVVDLEEAYSGTSNVCEIFTFSSLKARKSFISKLKTFEPRPEFAIATDPAAPRSERHLVAVPVKYYESSTSDSPEVAADFIHDPKEVK